MDYPVPKDWFAGYFEDYDRLRSSERSRRLEPRHERLNAWLVERLRPDAEVPEVERAWDVVVELVQRAADEETLAFVAAGPLEDLVRLHADRVADRLVERTRSDAKFREAMRNVWGWEDVSATIRARLFPLLAHSEADAAEALKAFERPPKPWRPPGRRPRR